MSLAKTALKHRRLSLALLLSSLVAAGAVSVLIRSKPGVSTMQPVRGPIVEAVYGLGTVAATRTYDLKLGVTNHVEEFFVSEGQAVVKGEKLLRLFDSGLHRAPFSGTITSLPFKVGEAIFPQANVLSLVDLTDFYVSVSLEQHSILRVKEGQEVRLSFENILGEKVVGKVRSVYPSSGQFLVRVDAQRYPNGVLPGMTVDVAIEVARREDALLVPVASVRSGRVILLDGVRRKKVDVTIGAIDGEWAEVLSGALSTEDQVVVGRK